MLDLLEDIGLWGSLPTDVPIDLNKKLLKDEGEQCDDLGRYRRLVGKLNYQTITGPNIFICNQCGKSISGSSSDSLLEAVIHIVRYLKKAPGLRILYRINGHLRV